MIKEDTEAMTLIQNTLNGSPQAQEEFYSKYRKIINDYLRHKFPKINDIDDCASEILIKVFYSLDKYDPEKSSVKSWILTIAKHYMIDAWRANPVFGTTFTSSFNNSGLVTCTVNGSQNFISNTGTNVWADGGVLTTTNNADCITYANSTITSCNTADFENCNTITYISSQVSPSDFHLLNMKYMQGYSHCEIGQEFQLTSSTVSNRINYIKTKLKKNNSEIYEE
jgi:RNA polymerase sigma factor (sigma-70 family)